MSTLSHDDKTPEQPADGDKVFLRDISDTGTGVNDGIIVATVDLLGQTIIAGRGAEIKTQYEAQADTNAFTDADHAKLDGIAAGAEVNPTQVTPAEKTAGTETAERSFSPQDIHDMIDTHAPNAPGGGGGSFSEADLENLMEGKTPAAPAAADEFLFRDVSGTDTVGVATPQQIVEAAHTAMGIEPQNRISTTRDPNADDDGNATNGVAHIINDLWTNYNTDTSFICQDITTKAAVWAQIDGGAGSGIASVVEDTTPQLGGTLDAQSNSITGVADVEMVEAADHTTAPSAGKGVWWVRNDTPCVPVFTDDAGTDHVLNASGGGGGSSVNTLSVEKNTAGTITKGQVVYVAGYDTDKPTVELADADATSALPPIGVANASITDSTAGDIVMSGIIDGMDTSAFTAGDNVYLDTTAGALVATRPDQEFVYRIGQVIYSHASNGILRVNIERVQGRYWIYGHWDGKISASSSLDNYVICPATGTIESCEVSFAKFLSGSDALNYWSFDVQNASQSDRSALVAAYDMTSDPTWKSWTNLGALNATAVNKEVTKGDIINLEVAETGVAPDLGNNSVLLRVKLLPDN